MSEDRIQRKDLVKKLSSIKRPKQWTESLERLGFRITSGGKHPYVARDPENPNDSDIKSLVTTIPSHLHTVMNKIILKQVISSPVTQRLGITEDDIWSALGLG